MNILKNEAINSLFKMAMKVAIEEILSDVNKGLHIKTNVSKREIAYQAMRQYLLSISVNMQKAFYFENNEDVKQIFEEYISKDRDNPNIIDFAVRAGENGNRIMLATKEKMPSYSQRSPSSYGPTSHNGNYFAQSMKNKLNSMGSKMRKKQHKKQQKVP